MPNVDLSSQIPPNAKWIKVHYEMAALKPDARLIARLWSGVLDDAVVIEGPSGDAFIKLDKPQMFSYQNPVNVDLKLKVVAYKATA